jgi:DNA-binding NarL/FixJ family response regulator
LRFLYIVRASDTPVDSAIRVAVANQPRLMRDVVVSTMSDQPDIKVVAEIEDESQISSVIDQTTPDFLIVTLQPTGIRASDCEALLRRHPDMKVLALAQDGNSFIFYSASLEIHTKVLEGSEDGILAALRANTRVLGA